MCQHLGDPFTANARCDDERIVMNHPMPTPMFRSCSEGRCQDMTRIGRPHEADGNSHLAELRPGSSLPAPEFINRPLASDNLFARDPHIMIPLLMQQHVIRLHG